MPTLKFATDAARRSTPASSGVARSSLRRHAERRGRIAEWIAAAALIVKGYWIVARRVKGPFGEIDLIAVRGRRLAFVEVKQRRSTDEAAAALSARQAIRLGDAAERWLWRNPGYRGHAVGLDAVLLGPRMLPRHVPNALNAW